MCVLYPIAVRRARRISVGRAAVAVEVLARAVLGFALTIT
jgi:hypothetical protein